jgi:arylsulfatase A-like enzyme
MPGLSYVDEQVGELLKTLDGLGLSKDTLILLTSDHGEEFLEHGDFGHGGMIHLADNGKTRIKLYDELLHVPLIVYLPEFSQLPRRIPALVSLVDLSPPS